MISTKFQKNISTTKERVDDREQEPQCGGQRGSWKTLPEKDNGGYGQGDRKMQRGDGLNRDYGHSPATRDEELKDQMCR